MASRLCVWALGSGLVLAILGPMFGGSLWLFDLMANLAAQWSLFAAASMAVGLWIGFRDGSRGLLRRWWLTALAGIALLAQVVALIPGRTAWIGRDVATTHGGLAEETGEKICVLVFNAYSDNLTPERAIGLVERSDADVVVLLEQRRRFALESEAIREKFSWIEVNRPLSDKSPWMIVLSRWPMKSMGIAEGFGETPGCFPVLVNAPEGSFAVVAIHARSPRSPRNWRMGNKSVRAAAEAVRRFEMMGVETIVVGDLNGTPSGWRSRWLERECGLKRCKPLLYAVGTWPGVSVWPASLAIDDVWAPKSWRVTGWTTIGGPDYGGSDHRAVKVELAPGGRLSGPFEAGEDQPMQSSPLGGGQEQGIRE